MISSAPREQRLRDGEAERLRGLEVDYQLEPGRLLYRQIGRLCALEDLVHEHRRLAIEIRLPGAVGHQSSRIDETPDPRERLEKRLERYRDTAIWVRHAANVLDEARRHARACLSH